MASANGHGGRRPGAGRPKGSRNKATLERERRIQDLLGAGGIGGLVAASFEVVGTLMLDPTAPPVVRLQAARMLQERFLGRPAQSVLTPAVVCSEGVRMRPTRSGLKRRELAGFGSAELSDGKNPAAEAGSVEGSDGLADITLRELEHAADAGGDEGVLSLILDRLGSRD